MTKKDDQKKEKGAEKDPLGDHNPKEDKKEEEIQPIKETKISSKKRKDRKYLELGFSPYFGILRDMGYEFKRGIATEVKKEDVEELLKKHKLLKEVEQ